MNLRGDFDRIRDEMLALDKGDFDRIRDEVLALDIRKTEKKWWARLAFRTTGRWPEAVVDERLYEDDLLHRRLRERADERKREAR